MSNAVGISPTRRVYKVVLTGGPCGGKTTGQDRLANFFENIGWKVFRVPETATVLLKGGVKFSELTQEEALDFQLGLLKTMMSIESVFFKLAETCSYNCLVICDRGTFDPAAYIDDSQFECILKKLSLDKVDLRDNRYNQIVHLVTAADGASEFYGLANNVARSEGLEEAVRIDKKTREAWIGHPYFDIIDNKDCNSFEDKILKLIQVVCDRAGVDYGDRLAPDSKKRKFLISWVDDHANFPKYQEFRVMHDYLLTELAEPGSAQIRIRKRGQGMKWCYTYTARRLVNGKNIETRMHLSLRDYMAYKKFADPRRGTTFKVRRCFMHQDQYFQLDFFDEPSPPQCKNLILLETYTTNKSPDFPIPEYLHVEREVTSDPAYSLYNLSLLNERNSS